MKKVKFITVWRQLNVPESQTQKCYDCGKKYEKITMKIRRGTGRKKVGLWCRDCQEKYKAGTVPNG